MTAAPDLQIGSPAEIPNLIAATRPHATALIDKDRTVSYVELDQLSNRVAHGIQSLGLPNGAHIAIRAGNSIDYVPIHFGVARTNHVLAHFSSRFTAAELAHALNLTKAEVLIGDAGAWSTLAAAASDINKMPRLIAMDADDGPENALSFTDLVKDKPESSTGISHAPEDPITILFTSGTTGMPKAAIANHLSRIIASTAAAEDHPIDPDDVCAITIPLCHAAGLYSWFTPVMVAGAAGVILPKWDPLLFLDAVEAHGITSAFVVPTQLAMLLDHPKFDASRLVTLRRLMYGGAAATEELLARAQAALPDLRIVQAFGSTETSHVLSQQPEERAAKPGSLGKPGPRIEVGVFTAPGIPAKPGEEGELCTRGPHLFTEYLDNPEDTAAYYKSDDGWGWNGDLATIDEDGVVTLIGRTKEVIISGGMNISPVELENAIEDHPAVAECAAFGFPDEQWGELPAAAIVRRDGQDASEEDILAHCAAKVARFKRLRRVVFTDALPATSSGKVQRMAVKEKFAPALASK